MMPFRGVLLLLAFISFAFAVHLRHLSRKGTDIEKTDEVAQKL